MPERVDIAVVGAGAAGLMAAIFAGRTALQHGRTLRIVALDGARRIGAKILVAGGGRCNVTHHAVDESAYAGSSRHAIRNVLRRFDVPETIAFFRALGVELKREDTGKLFPTTDDAHTVLNALLNAARDAGAEVRHPWRVASVERGGPGFVLTRRSEEGTPLGAVERIEATRLVLATGGMALPRTGSDGVGYGFARALGHTTTARIFPALVPLTLPRDHPLCALSGMTLRATLELRSGTGKRLVSFTNSTLLAHFGITGPSVLDISRYYLDELAMARLEGRPEPSLVVNLMPGLTAGALDAALVDAAQRSPQLSPARWLSQVITIATPLPERLARVVCEIARVDPSGPLHGLTRDRRRSLAWACVEMPLPISGDRGFVAAEVTAGGVPLAQVALQTMESRACPGLYLCGEILDVDGRIGGFNFQWAWASGFVAGSACAASVCQTVTAEAPH